METSLHRQLKMLYASDESKTEVRFAGFRIDAITEDGELIEIQHASLGALRDKTKQLLKPRCKHRLRIVKPIVRRKRITTICEESGEVLRSRMSPKSGDWLDLFEDLVHFASVFPRKGLTLEALLIDAEEIRADRIPKRRRGKNYTSLDIQLTEVGNRVALTTIDDLLSRLPLQQLDNPFDTAQLAQAISRPRWLAQKVAYCLREMGGISLTGKKGNSQLYSISKKRTRPPKSAA